MNSLHAPSPLNVRAVRFARYLRGQGLPVSPAQTLDFVHSLPILNLLDRNAVRDAARAVFVRRREELALFEAAFDRFWFPALLDPTAKRGLIDDQRQAFVWGTDAVETADLLEPPETAPDRSQAWSAVERLRRRDFGEMDAAEVTAVQQAIVMLARRLPMRRSRRFRPAAHGSQLDLRRTLRDSLRTSGDPLWLARRARRVKPRPLLLLCDVSGSMERYARVLLQFAYALTLAGADVEAFVFATQLTRVSELLRTGTGRGAAQGALHAAVAAARDWGGGTRIGAGLHTLRTRWPQTLGRGAIVLLISDGCDRGDIPLLGQELAMLRRRCRRLIWLNPWLGQEGYQPATRGMQAALPHIDELLPVHNLASLEELVAVLSRLA